MEKVLLERVSSSQLQGISPEGAAAIVAAANAWNGEGWTTSSATQTVYTLTGVQLVNADWNTYGAAWSYVL